MIYVLRSEFMKKKLVTFLAVILTVCCALGLAACGTDEEDVVEVTNVTLDETEITLTEGEYYVLTATITPSNANDQSTEWTSSDESVVTVDYGSVYAVAEGEAIITVTTSNGLTATCNVTVEPKEPEPPTLHTVTFNACGGQFEDGSETYEVQIEHNETLSGVTVTRGSEYVFTNWYKDEYRTNVWDFDEDIVTAETQLYAGWKYLNKYQSVIDALEARIKTERQNDSEEVEILTVFTDNDGCLCFVEKDSTGAFSYKTDICDFEEVKGNAEIISAIPTATLTLLKNYNDTYTSDNDALIADSMAYRYTDAKNVNEAIIYSCVSEWEYYSEGKFATNGPWYSYNVRAIIAEADGKVYDCSFKVIAGVTVIGAVANGTAMSEEVDMVTTELGETANDFYAERLKEWKA